MTSPFDLGVVELLDRFGAGTLLPSEAVEACIERIDAVDGRVNAVVTMAVKPAHLDAAESDRRWRDGEARALEGVPYGLKDIIDTAGLRTTGGSILYADRVPTADAGVVTALRAAGAVLVAKLQTYEFAYGGNPHFGPAHNPWNLAHTPGGSSEGPAAALAARELPLTIGTDTGGSIRIPASFCGVTGFKPSTGAVPTSGVMPQAPTFDHVGPMARSARDCAAAFPTMAGQEHERAGRCELAGLRIGVPRNWFFEVLDPNVASAVESCAALLAREGADVFDVELENAGLARGCFGTVTAPETANSHRARWDVTDRFGPALAGLVRRGREVAAVDYIEGLEMARRVQDGARSAFRRCDALLVPGTACSAPRLDDMEAVIGEHRVPWLEVVSRTTLWHNVVGCPTVAIPFGFDRHGLPVAVQLATAFGSDVLCLAVASAIQDITDFHEAAPTLD